MQKEEVKAIWERYRDGKASAEDVALLESWYLDYEHTGRAELNEEEYQERLLIVGRNLPLMRKTTKLWPRIAAVSPAWKIAAAVAAITLGTWLYVNEIASSRNASRNDEMVMNDIAPGKNTATLTLANGKIINLDTNKTGIQVGGRLAYNDKSEIASVPRNDEEVKSFAVTTPRGGTYQVVLPDGTEVWLNADSKIRFPSQFTGAKRQIFLEGEAYFQVAKDKAHPFIVQSKGQEVTVLGTHFNINAYEDEMAVRTTLLEGRVDVNGTILSPNQQAINAGSNIQVKAIDPASAIDWKNGEFVSENENLASIMRKVSRWYNVEVVYASEELKKRTFDGSLSRYDNVSRILKAIEFAGAVKFKVEGRMITVLKN
jgi:transmembrane sensor